MASRLSAAGIVLSLAAAASAFVAMPSGAASRIGTDRCTDRCTDTMLQSQRTTSDELIPREILFGNPENVSPLLSPDGKHLAYLAPSPDGVMNVFIRDLVHYEASGLTNGEARKFDRMITNEPKRAIRSVAWAYDSRTILYMNDKGGDENFHLFAVNAVGTNGTDVPPVRDLTPGENVKAQNIFTNYRYPDQILVGTNERDSKCFDMYRVFLATGEKFVDTINPGDVIGWKTEDESFEIRAATVRNSEDSSTTVRVRFSADLVEGSQDDTEWRDVFHFPYGEEGGLLNFCADGGKTGYLTSSLGRETTALLKVDLKTGETLEEIYSNEKCNVGGVTLEKDTKELRALTINYARTERVFFDEELEKDYEFLKSTCPNPNAEIGVASRSLDETKWVAMYLQSDGPTEYVIYDKTEQTVTPLFVSNPKLLPYTFSPMEDVRIPAHDGLELVGYLTRAVTEGPSPMILLVHGGPWARDYWGFNSRAQWFANRGYATLQVNFRGSTGYGKTFLHKGDKQWGVGDMQHDLTSAVDWAVEQGIADKDNVCIYGGSYGGYACLAGLTFTPDVYKCGVDIVGPSNIKTLLDSIPDYWAPLRNGMLLKIGDVDGDEEFNKKISPLFHVDNIKAPLLIGQGANDPRVKQAEADQIAFLMQKKNIPVEYVPFPDEGHGFARPENRVDFNGRAELFLAKHLGGRAEEFAEVEGSTATFPLLEKEEAVAK
ncbi:hypothetical protein ACHAXT_004906 [Thalassiosira profunda]